MTCVEQNGEHYVHELRQISLSQELCHSYSFIYLFFHFYSNVGDTL